MVLAPALVAAQIVPCDGVDKICDWDALITLSQRVLNFIVTISVIIAALMFAYAGWLFFSDTGNVTNVTKGKTVFADVVIGLIIVLVAWLVVDTILDTLTDRGLKERANNPTGAFVDIGPSIV